MKRDWDCIRAILVTLEENEDPTGFAQPNAVSGFDAEAVSYNMKLLIEADLIEGIVHKRGPMHCVARSMTWEGHELLDKMRSEKLWNRIKKLSRDQAIPLSFQAIKFLGARALESLFHQ